MSNTLLFGNSTTQHNNNNNNKKALLRCLSCREEYCSTECGTCKECYEEASETEDELKREIDDLKAKVAFLRLGCSPLDGNNKRTLNSSVGFYDLKLCASDEFATNPVFVPAHKLILASRSPVFKAMLEIEMKESQSGTINISDVSYEALRAFVNYLYTAEVCLDEQMACDLLVLAEKYEVKHLKMHCEKFIVSKLNWDNSVASFSFAHQYNAKHLQESALSMIIDNMDSLTKSEEYVHLVEKDPRLVVEIYEAYLSKQVNTAARIN